jgi:hypothetical protein
MQKAWTTYEGLSFLTLSQFIIVTALVDHSLRPSCSLQEIVHLGSGSLVIVSVWLWVGQSIEFSL